MEFFNSAVTTLQTIVVGLGGALCVWGGINLLEGYGQDIAKRSPMFGCFQVRALKASQAIGRAA